MHRIVYPYQKGPTPFNAANICTEVAQPAEAVVLETIQCRFDSDLRYQILEWQIGNATGRTPLTNFECVERLNSAGLVHL